MDSISNDIVTGYDCWWFEPKRCNYSCFTICCLGWYLLHGIEYIWGVIGKGRSIKFRTREFDVLYIVVSILHLDILRPLFIWHESLEEDFLNFVLDFILNNLWRNKGWIRKFFKNAIASFPLSKWLTFLLHLCNEYCHPFVKESMRVQYAYFLSCVLFVCTVHYYYESERDQMCYKLQTVREHETDYAPRLPEFGLYEKNRKYIDMIFMNRIWLWRY